MEAAAASTVILSASKLSCNQRCSRRCVAASVKVLAASLAVGDMRSPGSSDASTIRRLVSSTAVANSWRRPQIASLVDSKDSPPKGHASGSLGIRYRPQSQAMLAVKATKIPRPTRCVHMLHVSLWRMNIWRGDSVSSMVPDEGVKQPRGWHGLTMDRARDCRYADAPSAELLSILPRCDTRCVCNDCARPTRAPRSSCISCSAIASLQP